jgi:hypothetical protein
MEVYEYQECGDKTNCQMRLNVFPHVAKIQTTLFHPLQVNRHLYFSNNASKQALSTADHMTKLCNEDHLTSLPGTVPLLLINDRASVQMELMELAVKVTVGW